MNTQLNTLLAEKDPEIHTVGPDIRVADAVRDMNYHNIGALIVLERNKIVGIFTERDVLLRVVAADLDPVTTMVKEVMTEDPVCVTPTMSVEQAMVLVTEEHFRHLPVVQNGQMCGLISSGDLTRWVIRDQKHRSDDLNSYITDTQISSGLNTQRL